MTHWFHLDCAAYKRPESFLEMLAAATEPVDAADRLRSEAENGIAHHRLARVDGAERSPSGRAHCRSCRGTIEKDAWRISLVFYEDGRFEPSGFIHVSCAQSYFGTTDVLPRVKRFSPGLSDDEIRELAAELRSSNP